MTTREALDLPAELARFGEAWESLAPSVRLAVAAEVAVALTGVITHRMLVSEGAAVEQLPNFAQCQRDCAEALMLWRTLAVRIARDADDEMGPQPVFVEVPL